MNVHSVLKLITLLCLLPAAGFSHQTQPPHVLRRAIRAAASDTARLGRYKELMLYYWDTTQNDSAIVVFNEAAHLHKKYPYHEYTLLMESKKAYHVYNTQGLDKGKSAIQQILAKAKTAKYRWLEIEMAIALARANLSERNYLKGLKELKTIESSIPATADYRSSKLKLYQFKAKAYYYLGDTLRTKEQLHLMIPLLESKTDTMNFYTEYLTYHLDSFTDYIKLSGKALKLANTLNDAEAKIILLQNIGDIHYEHGKYMEAIPYVIESLRLSKIYYNGLYNNGVHENTLGQIFLKLGEYDKALRYATASLEMHKKGESLFTLEDVYQVLAEAHYGLGHYEEAHKALQLYNKYNEEARGEEVKAYAEQLNAQDEAIKQEHNLEEKKTQMQIQEAVLKVTQRRRYGLYGVLGLAVFLMGFGIYNLWVQQVLVGAIARRKEKVEKQTRELKQLNLVKDRMFSLLGHDLRSPITELQELLRLWSSPRLTAQKKNSLINRLHYRVHNLGGLLDNLLEWGNLQLKSQPLQTEPFALVGLVDELYLQLASSIEHKELLFKKEVPDLHLVTDRNQLMIILRNLLTNAIKFTPVGGEIGIKAHEQENTLIVCVFDSGIGMDHLTLKSLDMEMASKRGTQGEEGVGIGLSLCQQLARQLGIQMHLSSTLGQGTSVRLEIPNHTKKSDSELTFVEDKEMQLTN